MSPQTFDTACLIIRSLIPDDLPVIHRIHEQNIGILQNDS